ncbi:CAP domain-containing protein [Deinococcus multiflagellatus]|uniref:CAP domain-containing protein n=1 Tax=Deinococcus multiflagellatus TaxID=1656887 RepID=UPI001CCBC9A0|nr:CAP domain-containing protein [Deinococcus multiflagellatus]MBZ9712624.1 CAP domain-containing protein [Deinococcus multiflagellatus]
MSPALTRSASLVLLALTLAACGGSPSAPVAGGSAPVGSTPNLSDTLAAQAVATPIALTPGQSLQLRVTVGGRAPQPGELTWTSGNAAVATVNQSGLVTATGAGSTTVRAALTGRPSVFLDFPVTVGAAAPAPSPTPPAPDFAQRVLDLTNAARATGATCGTAAYPAVPALTLNAQLTQAAQGHASDMAAQNYFSHTGKDGRTFAQRITAAGYAWRAAAENIAAGQSTPEQVVAGWLKSEGHCKNMMSPAYKELGVGYAQGGSYGHYWVQDFGSR